MKRSFFIVILLTTIACQSNDKKPDTSVESLPAGFRYIDLDLIKDKDFKEFIKVFPRELSTRNVISDTIPKHIVGSDLENYHKIPLKTVKRFLCQSSTDCTTMGVKFGTTLFYKYTYDYILPSSGNFITMLYSIGDTIRNRAILTTMTLNGKIIDEVEVDNLYMDEMSKGDYFEKSGYVNFDLITTVETHYRLEYPKNKLDTCSGYIITQNFLINKNGRINSIGYNKSGKMIFQYNSDDNTYEEWKGPKKK